MFLDRRVQFPVRSAFAITINKSQRATLEFVGIYLNDPVFSHGQLFFMCQESYLFMATNSEFENVTEMLYLKKFFKILTVTLLYFNYTLIKISIKLLLSSSFYPNNNFEIKNIIYSGWLSI